MAKLDADALAYHELGRPGKIEVVPTKPCLTARDLTLAYSPGVAAPCLAIEADPALAYRYTNKGNLVAVLSNGTAVLGLGNIGSLAGKPVMEGKGVLFKRFAHVDVFDIELNTHDPKEIIRACQLLEPTFGGINLEDIKAPECFEVEEALKASMSIPVFHDDQHGTAIIAGAALLNALTIVGKAIEDVTLVVNGAGASGIACANFMVTLGVKLEHVTLVDTKGVVYKGRTAGMNVYKERFAKETDRRTLADAMRGVDVFLGCSVKDCVTQDMVRSMADHPIVFALANPDPEITYEEARAAKPDAIIATGRSDFPNQVNNVLGFPFLFRGALDVRASCINEEMKIGAARALAELAREPVPDEVSSAYGGAHFEFGPEYIIPKPFDMRLLSVVSPAVAKAACESGVAREPITDWAAYRSRLLAMTNRSELLMHRIRSVAGSRRSRVVFAEGEHPKVLEACRIMAQEFKVAPILLGRHEVIEERAARIGLELDDVAIYDPLTSDRQEEFATELYRIGSRRGYTPSKSRHIVTRPLFFGMMMMRLDMADTMVMGLDSAYIDTVRRLLPLSVMRPGVRRAAGFNILLVDGNVYVIGDTTLNIDPDAKGLSDIALLGAQLAADLGLKPKIAMLSFSNFGDSNHPRARKVRAATELLKRERPDLVVDGEMHGDVAVVPNFAHEHFPDSLIQGDANVLICPDLDSANVAAKLVGYLGQGREVIGPILEGFEHPLNVVTYGSTSREIANLAALGCYRASIRS